MKKYKHRLDAGTEVIIWDAGEDSGKDRYTAIFYGTNWIRRDRFKHIWHMGLCLSEGGYSISLWDEFRISVSNFGRRITWDSLSEDTRKHILRRYSE